MSLITTTIKTLITLFTSLAGLLVAIFLASYFGLIPGFRTLIVLSGSMEPALKVGSLAIISPQNNYQKDDIISFNPADNKKDIVTHRIVSISDQSFFQTAGDVNQEPDPNPIKSDQILGKLILSLPYFGFVANFLKQPSGFILFVIVPITILVYEEFRTLRNELQKIISKNKSSFNQSQSIHQFLILPLSATLLALASASAAYFSDQEKSISNSFVAGVWATPDTPTNIVINEVYYDVSSDHQGLGIQARWEWLELYNPSQVAIDLTNWTISDNSSSDILSASAVLNPGEFVIISPSSQQELENTSDDGGNWIFPAGTKFIDLDNATIGNGLSNDGDRLMLTNTTGDQIDTISYGTDISVFDPACPAIATGHSLERQPKGLDTNTATDFIDQTNPSPGS